MKKCVLFVILEPYADWEAAYLSSALYMLGRGRFEVKTVSLTREPVASIGGFRVLPDYDINSVPSTYEALVLIGGLAWRNEEARRIRPLVEQCRENGKVLGGICDAAAFLGTVGALNDAYQTMVGRGIYRRTKVCYEASRQGWKDNHGKRHGSIGICEGSAVRPGGGSGKNNHRMV